MPGYTAGDALDWHWVWVGDFGHYVIWDMGSAVSGARVYPSQNHGPYIGGEFDEYDVYASNDQTTWVMATQIALYYDHDEAHMMTHDGVKDYTFSGPLYQFVKIVAARDSDYEIDAVEVLPPPAPAPEFNMSLPIITSIATVLYISIRKRLNRK